MLDKLNNGEKISQRDAKALEEMKKQATVATDKMIEALKIKFGPEGSEEFIAFIKSTTENCVCSAEIEKPKKGPNADFYFSFNDDCKKCLEEQKKKQEQAAQIIKKVQKFLIVKMQCGCFTLGNLLQDFGHDDKNCEEVINKVEMVKSAIKSGKSIPTTDLTIQGQILIGNVCYTDLQVISIKGNLDPKKFEINSDGITFKNVLTFNIPESDNRKMKVELLRKYLFEEVKKEDNLQLQNKNESDKLGTLSAKYESGNNGVGTISTGKGDHGGMSYGLYQFASKNGSIDNYIDSPEFSQWKELFNGLTPTTSDFNKAWKKLAEDEPDAFKKSQHEYIYRTHYLVLKENSKDLINLDNYSDVLKDVCWSTAVHHGKDTGVLKRALKDKDISKLSEQDIIIAIYEERGKKDENGELAYFHSSSKKMQDGIAKRFESELNDALLKLK